MRKIGILISIIFILISIGSIYLIVEGNQKITKLAKESTEKSPYVEANAPIVGKRANGVSYRVLFDDVANIGGREYTLNDNIENYDFIEVYAKAYDARDNTKPSFSQEQRIRVENIDYEGDTPYTYRVGFYQGAGLRFLTSFKFTSNNTLYLHETEQEGCTNAQIYMIIGYQY